MAASKGHVGTVQILLANGANIDAQAKNGSTALHNAAFNDYSDVASLLLLAHADTTIKNTAGMTALQKAMERDGSKVVQAFMKHGTSLDLDALLRYAALKNRTDDVEILVKRGADIAARESETGESALHVAAKSGHAEVVELLLNKNAPKEATDDSGQTPLHVAVLEGHVNVVELLLARKANAAARRKSAQETPLHGAVRAENCSEIIKLLLKQGADIEGVNKNGDTPLESAVLNRHHRAVQVLLDPAQTAQEDLRVTIPSCTSLLHKVSRRNK